MRVTADVHPRGLEKAFRPRSPFSTQHHEGDRGIVLWVFGTVPIRASRCADLGSRLDSPSCYSRRATLI